MIPIGEKIKNAIKGKGMSQEDAAKKLGISRQTLHNSILKMHQLEEDVLQNVITTLGLTLQDDNDVKKSPKEKPADNEKYIALLEKTLHERESDIATLKDELSGIKKSLEGLMPAVNAAIKNKASLEQLHKDQQTIMDWNLAYQEALSGYIAQTPQQARTLSKTASKIFVQKRKETAQKGIHSDKDI